MTNYPPTVPEPGPPNGRNYWAARPPWYAAVVGGAIFVILVVVLALLLRDDGNEIQTVAPTLTSQASTSASDTAAQTTSTGPASTTVSTSTTAGSTTTSTTAASTTTSTTAASTTTSTTAATTTTTEDPAAYASAMWPWFDSSLRYTEPVEAARGFAEDYVGFSNPVVGPFQQGDARSGEVEIKPTGDGPVTTVLVRQLGSGGTWWVLGAVAEHIAIDSPDALEVIDSPLRVSGEALAFEGVVEVELRADGAATPLITGTVTGGGGEMMPFEGEFSWTSPGAGSGAVLLLTRSMDDDGVWTVAAVRVAFAAESTS